MKKTTITKDDGRYLIFYSFEDESAADSEKQSESSDQDQPAGNDD